MPPSWCPNCTLALYGLVLLVYICEGLGIEYPRFVVL